MAPSPTKMNLGLTNPRWRTYVDFLKERVDRQLNRMKSHFDEFTEKMNETSQRSTSLEQDVRQSRLAMEADVTSDTKTRNRMEDVAVERVISGDSSSAEVDPDPMLLTSFGDDSNRPPALPCSRHDALVDNDAAAPKPCLSSAEMRTRTAAGSLLPAGTASTATRTIFHQPPLWLCLTKEIKSRTSNQYATNYSSFWTLKVLETISRQTPVFDPGGSTGRLRACPLLGASRALLCGELFR